MQKRAIVRGTVLRPRRLEEGGGARAFEREVGPALADGRVRPLVDSVYRGGGGGGGLRPARGRGKVGKVLVEFA